ncbi:endoribonuclease Dcr-1 [Aricia agestis]|uniref:endoribonuclease Dcr-1 n=1 Tax=Aricia agestis TaxID=91739 RepID=UPI001C20601A|nr:endoribonuclease Dcr-1 [Aricia agestis]
MMESCSRFTAAEGGARLAAAASTRNILVTEYTAFIPMNLLIEHAYKIRGTLTDGKKRSVYLTRPSRTECVAHEYNILTSLKVCRANKYSDVENWKEEVEVKELLVCTSEVLSQILEEGVLTISNINVLIIDSCHLIFQDQNLQNIMKHYKECELEKPRILALTYPLFTAPKDEDADTITNHNLNDEEEAKDKESKDVENADKEIEKDKIENEIEQDKTEKEKDNETKTTEIGVYQNMDDFDMYEKLEWKIEELEKALCCKMDLAEDIDAGKRLAITIAKPKELLIEYRPPLSADDQQVTYQDLEAFMRNTIEDASDFIDEHRYDPTEIYGEDLYEEFKDIPDPTIEPKQIFKEFLYVLDQLGPYAADKAAFTLLVKLEKLKIKVPYERHFLLLCLCTSVFVKIRSYADYVFSKYESDWDKISSFSTPKVLRFAEILEQFKPLDDKNIVDSNKCNQNVNTHKEVEVENAQETNLINNVNTTNINGENHADTDAENVNIDKDNTETSTLDDNKSISKSIEEVDDDKSNLAKDDANNLENNHEEQIANSNDDNTQANDVNNVNTSMKRSKTSDLLNVIESCDFATLGNKIEDRVNTYAANLKDLDDVSITDTTKDKTENVAKDTNETNQELKESAKLESQDEKDKSTIDTLNDLEKADSKIDCQKGFGKRSNRTRGRTRAQRSNVAKLRLMQQNPDALCGIVFMKEALIAKIMFMLIVDMSRSRSALSQLCAQYCASEPNTSAEARESQRQGRKQEDVLKKFRMHECNLLLATPDLEEGIDLPRCNLVVRWDVPPSYRSHVLCRGRARAPRSSVTLLANAETDSKELIHNLAVYKELDQIITRKCGCGIQNEPPQEEENYADVVAYLIKPYTPANEYTEVKKHATDEGNVTEDNVFSEDSISDVKIEIGNDDTTKELIFDTKKDEFKETEPPDPTDRNDVPVNIEDTINGVAINDGLDNFKEIKYDLCNKSEKTADIASVDLSTAIALINRYCGKLPSDTFTRLAPQWWMERVTLPDRCGRARTAYVCTLRMPLNCPVKYNIVGHPMPTRVLARRMVALQACRILHKSGELDDQLMPIGKENFKAAELDNDNNNLDDNDSARPGTTKRRQYYYKRTAWAFTDCQPIIDCTDKEIEDHPTPTPEQLNKSRNTAWALAARLWCALPERYNTRGRRLHAPQHARQALGLMVAERDDRQLQIPAFPVYTRSGEVRVSVERAPDADVRLSPRRAKLIRRFMKFVFADVLRVRRRGMRLHADAAPHNNYYVVPTTKRTKEDGTTVVDIDWEFLELIYNHTEEQKSQEIDKPVLWEDGETKEKEKKEKDREVKKIENPLLKPGEVFEFDAEKYKDAVVTPWYRNQDQPQFFLVAEICWNLSPESEFPSTQHGSFRTYYQSKYGAELTQPAQPLLDVDHTSARLNLLTPRYVNRKGVALPVSSERTRRNKRDRLDQKQILVPELCRRHPFAAPLWFATVALPCVLYRINALLIADEIRRAVAIDVGLGIPRIDETTCPGFQWPPLDFGWSLAEVLSTDEKSDKKNDDDDETANTDEKQSAIENQNDDDDSNKTENKKEGEVKEKTLNDILQEKEAESGFEIGTWSNEMASSIPDTVEFDEFLEPLPANLTFCTSASGGANWSEPVEKPRNQYNPTRAYSVADSDYSYMSSDFDTDSEFNTDGSDEDTDSSGFNGKNAFAMGVRIEYKTAHEAEAVDIERRKPVAPAPQPDAADDARDVAVFKTLLREGVPPDEHIKKFKDSVAQHKKDIAQNSLIATDEPVKDLLPDVPEKQKLDKDTVSKVIKIKNKESEKDIIEKPVQDEYYEKEIETNDNESAKGKKQKVDKDIISSKETDKATETETEQKEVEAAINGEDLKKELKTNDCSKKSDKMLEEIFPYKGINVYENISLEEIEKNKRILLDELKKSLPEDEIKKMNCFSMKDINIDSPDYVNEKVENVGFDSKEKYQEVVNSWKDQYEYKPYYMDGKGQNGKEFDFDFQPDLEGHPGPSPSVILQALTMSNANDGINLERLETIGDSFLKFAITAYLYCAHPAVHEGKLSHMRSKQVSNLNLYRLGRNKRLGARMIASKFEPHDNWLPPCHRPPPTLHATSDPKDSAAIADAPHDSTGCFIPYNLITQHSIPDKSIADCVEALIGAYLLECGPRGALLFMSWLGIRVLPQHLLQLPPDHPHVLRETREQKTETQPAPPQPPPATEAPEATDSEWSDGGEGCEAGGEGELPRDWSWPGRAVGSLRPYQDEDGQWVQPIFGALKAPPSPLLRYIDNPEGELEQMLSGYEALEEVLQYRFRDRALLLQALTHASHAPNRLTDCYQRLEFLGDAILDYLITRHLFCDGRRHSPGALTDLRSALVNNTIFATLAARHGFHKYFRHMSPGLNEVLAKYVRIQEENGHSISEEHYLIQEDELEQAEDVEVPKALGDLFESVAGAIFLDSGMSLGAVWRSYGALMGAELEAFSAAAPKSPVRELLEAEPDTAKFGKPERLADGRRVRVCVEVFGRGAFKGVGRNYRIAKGTAARCALRHLKRRH